jgi:hypothetical protein
MTTENNEDKAPETPAPTSLDALNSAIEPIIEKAAAREPEAKPDEKPEPEAKPDEKPEPEAKPEAKSDEKAEPEAKPDVKPEAKPEAKPEVKPIDAVNDPIPNTVSERTRERMQTLIDRVKKADSEIQTHRELYDTVVSTGASPDEFGAMVQYMRLVHSDKPEDLRQAMQMIQAELRGMAMKLGEAPPALDFVSDHADLVEALNANAITPALAQEMAINRARASSNAQASEASRQQAQAQAVVDAAKGELDALGVSLAKSDPQYAAKVKLLVPALQPVFNSIPPAQWKATFEAAYKAMVLPEAATVPTPSAPAGPKPAPIRPSAPAGGGNKAPSTGLEALNAALGV